MKQNVATIVYTNYCKMDIAIANVSAMFWPLIDAIILLSYDELVETRFYEVMRQCMVDEKTFILDVCGHRLFHKDLNELFYGTRDFLVKIGENEKAHLIHQALLKMQGVVSEMEMYEAIDKLSVGEFKSKFDVISDLNNILNRLVI